MIFLNSRYASCVVNPISDAYGLVRRTVVRRPPTRLGDLKWIEYQWREGDRMDNVAADTLGDPGLWWYIMDANPTILDPFDIEPGTILKVPRNG